MLTIKFKNPSKFEYVNKRKINFQKLQVGFLRFTVSLETKQLRMV